MLQGRAAGHEINDFRQKTGEEALWTNSMFSGMPAYQISVLHENNFVRYIDQMIKLGLPRPVGIMFISMLGFYILFQLLGAVFATYALYFLGNEDFS